MSDDTKHPAVARMEAIEARLEAIEGSQKEAIAATLDGNRDAREILELFQALRGGIKVLGWLGTAAKWVTGMAAFGAAIYTAWHQAAGGTKP